MDSSAPVPAELERLLEHRDWLRALAHRLVGEAAADDLVQETWLAAMRRPPDPDRPVRPWLAGVVRRLARMRARGEGRRAHRQRTAARADALPSTAELIESVDTQRRLAQEVMHLEEPYRTTVLLRYFHGVTAAEISRRQGLPSGTVRWRLKRGLDELRGRLDREWGDRESWCVALVPFLKPAGGATTVATGSVGLGGIATTLWFRLAALVLCLALIPLGLRELGKPGARPEPVAPGVPELATGGAAIEAGSPETRAARPSVGSSSIALVFQEEGGARLSEARGVLFDALGERHVVCTDREGQLVLDGVPGPGVLWMERPGAFVARLELLLDASAQITLAAGEQFAGQVLCDGRPAGAVHLELDYDWLVYPEPIPEGVRAELGPCRRAVTDCDAAGRFVFHGLPSGWSGELWTPAEVVVVAVDGAPIAPTECLHIKAAGSHARIELADLAYLGARVTREDGRPVEGAALQVVLTFATGPVQRDARVSDAAGAVELRPRREDLIRADLVWSDTNRVQRASVEFEGLSFGEHRDLGDLVLAEGRALRVTLRDLAGAPAHGAAARTLPDGLVVALEPGREQLELDLPEGCREVEVGGAGWATQRLPVPRPGEELRAELLRSGRLRLTVTTPDGAPIAKARLRVTTEGELFAPDEPAQVRKSLGVFRGRTASAWRFVTDAQGRADFEGLRPGCVFQVAAFDALARSVGTLDLTAPRREGHEEQTLVLDGPLVDLIGTCTDARGEVLVGVDVTLHGSGKPLKRRSDGAGGFVLGGIGPEPFDLEVRKRGFAPLRIDGFRVRADDGEHLFQLEPGRDLVLVVEDERGERVEGGRLRATRGGLEWTSTEVAPGVLRLEDLPPEPVELALTAGGVFHPSDELRAEQAFRVPVLARLQVRWSGPRAADGPRTRVVLDPVTGGGRELVHVLGVEDQGGFAYGPLPAGSYRVRIEVSDDGRLWAKSGEPHEVELRGGDVETVTIDRP